MYGGDGTNARGWYPMGYAPSDDFTIDKVAYYKPLDSAQHLMMG